MHKQYGLVEIFAANGWMRGIVYEHQEELSLDGESDEVVFAEKIVFQEAWVHVGELTEADLGKDIQALARRGML